MNKLTKDNVEEYIEYLHHIKHPETITLRWDFTKKEIKK